MPQAKLSWPLDAVTEARLPEFSQRMGEAFASLPPGAGAGMRLNFEVHDVTPVPETEAMSLGQLLATPFARRNRDCVLTIEDADPAAVDMAVERIAALCGTLRLPAPDRLGCLPLDEREKGGLA